MKKIQTCLFLWLAVSFSLSAQYKASEWEARDKWQNAKAILESLQVTPGMTVADIGCHEGYLTMKLSNLLGPQGKVYAVDVEQHKLTKLDTRLQEMSVRNVHTVLGDYDDPKLSPNSLDAAVILDAYHEMDDYEKILQHLYHALKSGGRLVIVEPIADERLQWNREKQSGKHEIAMRFVLTDLKGAGFSIKKQQDPFIDRPSKNDRMWLVIAVKP